MLREPKKNRNKKAVDGFDNPAFEKAKGDQIDGRISGGRQTLNMDEPEHKTKSCMLDFFNPIVAVECAQLILKQRPFNARRVVILLLFCYFVVQASSGKLYIHTMAS